MIMEDAFKTVVQRIVSDGRHGPYAIAISEAIGGSITFSLEDNVWHEREAPECGVVVILSGLRKKRAGWRANHGRYLKPSDEQQPATTAKSKEH